MLLGQESAHWGLWGTAGGIFPMSTALLPQGVLGL